MAAIDPQVLESFEREFEKSAAPLPGVVNFIRRGAGGAGVGLGLGTAAGALTGSAAGAYRGYQDAKAEGGSGLAGALSGAASGAGKGAALGAAVGGVGGLAAGGSSAAAAKTLQAVAEGKGNPVSSFARFGQRQVHGLTGLVPGGAARGTAEYTRALHGLRFDTGSGEAVKALGGAKKALEAAQEKGNPQLVEQATKAVSAARARYDVAHEAEQKGLTSLPGLVKSLGSREGVKDLWRLGLKPQWQHQGALGKAMVALPVGMAGAELARRQDEDPEGRGRGERFLQQMGNNAGFMSAPFLPMGASELLGRGLGAVGKGVGKGIDAAVGAVSGRLKKPPMEELGHNPSAPGVEPSGMSEAVPRMYSNAALGKPPEGLML